MSRHRHHTDEYLVELIKADDSAAYTELYDRYWEMLYAMAYNRLHDTARAEDIVHDVFASLWKNRRRLHVGSIRAWLATAVKYMIIRQIDRAERFRRYAKEKAFESIYLAEDQEEDVALTRLLTAEINKLPEKCRIIFQLRQQGLTNPEIAEATNTSVRTVENQINRGLRVLRVALKHYLFSGFPFF